ncbi:SprB repeat-containing protein, partial [Flavobacterium gawalongense]
MKSTITYSTKQFMYSFIFKMLSCLIMTISISHTAFAQSGQGPCNAFRYDSGDGWRFVSGKWQAVKPTGSDTEARGIITCGSSASTINNLQDKGKIGQDGSVFDFPDLDIINCGKPTDGQDVVWLNFDIRTYAGSFSFQLGTPDQRWALYYVNTANTKPTALTPGTFYPATPTGLSGSCDTADLIYAGGLIFDGCGAGTTAGWETITVPAFADPTNYYIAIWNADGSDITDNLIFKARYGCGGSSCALQKDGADELNCVSDGYEVCATFLGSAGKWKVVDNATLKAKSYKVTTYAMDLTTEVSTETRNSYAELIATPLYVELGTQDGSSPQNDIKAIVCATYDYANPYDLSLTPEGIPADAPSDYVTCTSSGSFSGAGLIALSATVASTNVTCYNDTTGAIDITVTGGSPNYSYTWKKDGSVITATTEDLSGIGAGVYEVTVTDTKGCKAVKSITITQPTAALSIAVTSQTDVNCYNDTTGAINITVSGGTSGYTYTWKKDAS